MLKYEDLKLGDRVQLVTPNNIDYYDGVPMIITDIDAYGGAVHFTRDDESGGVWLKEYSSGRRWEYAVDAQEEKRVQIANAIEGKRMQIISLVNDNIRSGDFCKPGAIDFIHGLLNEDFGSTANIQRWVNEYISRTNVDITTSKLTELFGAVGFEYVPPVDAEFAVNIKGVSRGQLDKFHVALIDYVEKFFDENVETIVTKE